MPYILSRIFFILLGYALAAISSGYVVALAMVVTGTNMESRAPMAISDFFATGMLISMFIALFAAPFAAIVVAIGEWWAIRMKRYYGVAGIVIGLILSVMFYMHNWFPYVGGGYGSVAGLIYWWVAGRRAGIVDAEEKAQNRVSLLIVIGFMVLAGLLPTYLWFGMPMFGR
jgi:hypothetical protein